MALIATPIRTDSSWHPCAACGQPSDEDIRDLAALYRRKNSDWTPRRCFDRAYIETVKRWKPRKVRR
jgi:hypothetical protein